jgi:hypothetical protein
MKSFSLLPGLDEPERIDVRDYSLPAIDAPVGLGIAAFILIVGRGEHLFTPSVWEAHILPDPDSASI